jgi:hypothetical protein
MCDFAFIIPPTIPKTTLLRLKCEYENRFAVSNKEASDTLAEIQRKALHAAAMGRSSECFVYPTRILNAVLVHVYTMLPGCGVHTSTIKVSVGCPDSEKMTSLRISWD